jgi:hypothetical protein
MSVRLMILNLCPVLSCTLNRLRRIVSACVLFPLVVAAVSKSLLLPHSLNFNSVALVRDQTIPTERLPLVGLFANGGCRVVSAADPYGRNLDFLYRSRYLLLYLLTSVI